MKVAAISREVGNDPRTIAKYIDQEDWNAPVRFERKPIPSILDPYKPIIDEWLTADSNCRRKQRHTAKRVHDRLLKEYPEVIVSYRTVADYVRKKRLERFADKGAYLPLEHPPGEAQVDFGEADFLERGVLHHGYYLNLSFPHSNGGYMQLYKGQTLECLIEGLIQIFRHIGGVPYRIWFDNLRPVVTKILKEGNRDLTEGFLRFKEHHRFEAAFCNPDAGHEKGSVEGKVGYHRRNLLVPVPEVEDLVCFNRELLTRCDEDMQREHYRKDNRIATLFEEDQRAVLPLPSYVFEAVRYETVHTDGYGKFTLQSRYTYSTAPQYVRTEIMVRLSAYDVTAMDKSGRIITSHSRLFGDKKQESMDWLPYLTQLSQRPGALKYSGIHRMLPEELQDYLAKCERRQQRESLGLLARLTDQTDFPTAVEAFRQAVGLGAGDMDSVVAVFRRLIDVPLDFSGFTLSSTVPVMEELVPDIAVYESLFPPQGGKGH
jgi:transposase